MRMISFINHLETVRAYKKASAKKIALLLGKVEAALGQPLHEVRSARKIEEAIIEAAKHRRAQPNGHKYDPNDHRLYRFRLGIVVSDYLRYLDREREIDKNPYPKNSFRRPPRPEADWLTDDQIQRIKNCPHLSVRDQVMFRFMLDTGVRREEFINVRWKDINMSERLVHIPIAKMEKHRTIPFTPETRQWMEAYRPMAPGEYLTGEKLHTNAIGIRFQAISRTVGFRVHAHQVRHSAGRIWVAAGVHQFDIMKFLGHESTDMTAHYYHTEGSRLRMIQDKINQPLTTESVTKNN